MKKYLSIFFTAMLLFNNVMAQPKMAEVVNMVSGNNIGNVVKYFDNVVDITINDNQSTYSKAQAEMVMKNFFDKNNVSGFQVKYKGVAPNDESFYLIGDLSTKGRGVYRVYFFFKQKGKGHVLQEMKFELN
jgi:hypothetical protein